MNKLKLLIIILTMLVHIFFIASLVTAYYGDWNALNIISVSMCAISLFISNMNLIYVLERKDDE